MKCIQFLTIIIFLFIQCIPVSAGIDEDKSSYSYHSFEEEIAYLQKRFGRVLTFKKIGTSYFDQPIWAIKLGEGDQSILLIGAHHGREWITTKLLVKMMEEYAKVYEKQKKMNDYNPKVFDDVSIWFVPMLNPDGVNIQQGKLPGNHIQEFIKMNKGSLDFKRWKANGNGIDLNRQYAAGWNKVPSSSLPFYKGKRPFEAKEVRALVHFVKEIDPLSAISYHSAGHEIFWQFGDRQQFIRDYFLATGLAELTGYTLSIPPKESFGGGFTDWFIETFDRPAFTLELTDFNGESHPPISKFPAEWKRNKYVGIFLATEMAKYAH